MPQFDKITFFNQLFWLLFFFSGFYFLLLHYFLPRLSTVLKARQKMLNFYLEGVAGMVNERNKVQEALHNDCAVLLSQKNLGSFLGGTLYFIELFKSSIFTSFNTNLKRGIINVETRLYNQTSIFLVLLDLKVSNDFFSDDNF